MKELVKEIVLSPWFHVALALTLAVLFVYLISVNEKNLDAEETIVEIEEIPETWTWPKKWQAEAHAEPHSREHVGLDRRGTL